MYCNRKLFQVSAIFENLKENNSDLSICKQKQLSWHTDVTHNHRDMDKDIGLYTNT